MGDGNVNSNIRAIGYTEHKYGVEIEVGQLRIDLDVQRATVPSRLRKLIAGFNPDFLGELLVSARADGYYVLDGGHRLRVAQEMGIPTLVCETYSGLSKAEESRLFMGRNDRANIAKVDRDRNLNTAMDVDTMAINHACAAAGYVFIATSAEDSTFRDRAAAAMVMKDVERAWVEDNGPAHLQRVLEVYALIWGNDTRPVSSVLKALGKIMASKTVQHNIADMDRLEEKLRGLPDQEVENMARRHRENESLHRSLSLVTAVIEIIEEQYNRGLSADKRLRFRP